MAGWAEDARVLILGLQEVIDSQKADVEDDDDRAYGDVGGRPRRCDRRHRYG